MMERKASGGSIRSRRNSYSQPLNVTSSPSPLAQPNSSRSMLALKNGALRKYQLTSSEDLDSKTMSLHDSAGKRIWSKTRSISETEIIDTVFDADNLPRCTIHSPIKGWYLVVRSNNLTASLRPLSKSNPQHFKFSTESFVQISLVDGVEPPSPNVRLTFPIGDTGEDELGTTTVKPTMIGSSISNFILKPTPPRTQLTGLDSIFSRIRRLLGESKKEFTCVWREGLECEVFRFEESSPSLISLSTRGTLSINTQAVDAIGLGASFFVAVAFAYLDFLEDQDAYMAAHS